MSGLGLELDSAPSTHEDIVADTLRSTVLCGDVTPGKPLNVHAEAKMLKVCRTPARSARRPPADESLVQLRSHGGAAVGKHPAHDLETKCLVRTTHSVDDVRPARLEILFWTMENTSDPKRGLTSNSRLHFSVFRQHMGSRSRVSSSVFATSPRSVSGNASQLQPRSDDCTWRTGGCWKPAAGDAMVSKAATKEYLQNVARPHRMHVGAELASQAVGGVANRARPQSLALGGRSVKGGSLLT